MKLRVDLLPDSHYPDVALVIDVLRATTTAVALLERGVGGLLLTRTAEDALGVRAVRPEVLLAGERGGLTIPGFDLGNTDVGAVGGADVDGGPAMSPENAEKLTVALAKRANPVEEIKAAAATPGLPSGELPAIERPGGPRR